MSPNVSERAGAGRGPSGFTLVEVLVAMVVSVILGVSVIRFYQDSYHTYSQQGQISDRNQNAHFLLNKFVELLQQAGSALPDTGWSVITFPASGGIMIGSNPRGADQYNGFNLASSSFIPVTNGALFASSQNVLLTPTDVLIDYVSPGVATKKVGLDRNYNSGGFVQGVKDNDDGLDSIRVVSPVDLDAGDRVFAYREDQYVLDGSDLVIRPNGSAVDQMVLAENIDSVGFTFLTDPGMPTKNWKAMRSASIVVRARTEQLDPKMSPPAYHMISLPMNLILRNKI